MKTERKRIPPSSVRSSPVSTTETTTPAPKGSDDRLTLPVKDGKIDWTKVRESRAPALRKLLADSMPDQGGAPAAPPQPAAESPAINAALVGTLYDLLAQLEGLAAVKMYGCPLDVAVKALRFSDAEKEALSDPTVAVLNKWIPSSMLDKYGAEAMLLLMLASMTRQKFAVLGETIATHKKETPVKLQTVKSS